MTDTWTGIEDGAETEIKIKGSRFIGQALAATTEAEAFAALEQVRRRYHDARHHCWAYSLPPLADPKERFDDDGEPSQTAGPPIAQAIRASAATAMIVVVTRYFGGVKLGAGGLIRAYGEAARAAIAAAARVTHWIESRISVRVTYEDLGAVEVFLAQHADQLRGVSREFLDAADFEITVARSQADDLAAGLREATQARATIDVKELV